VGKGREKNFFFRGGKEKIRRNILGGEGKRGILEF